LFERVTIGRGLRASSLLFDGSQRHQANGPTPQTDPSLPGGSSRTVGEYLDDLRVHLRDPTPGDRSFHQRRAHPV